MANRHATKQGKAVLYLQCLSWLTCLWTLCKNLDWKNGVVVLQEHGMSGLLLWAICLQCNHCKSLVHIADHKSDSFQVGLGLRISSLLLETVWFCSHLGGEAVVMRISTFNSQPMVLKHKRVECPLLVRDKLLSQAEHSWGEQAIGRPVMWMLLKFFLPTVTKYLLVWLTGDCCCDLVRYK